MAPPQLLYPSVHLHPPDGTCPFPSSAAHDQRVLLDLLISVHLPCHCDSFRAIISQLHDFNSLLIRFPVSSSSYGLYQSPTNNILMISHAS
jgi:hypothetical protein